MNSAMLWVLCLVLLILLAVVVTAFLVIKSLMTRQEKLFQNQQENQSRLLKHLLANGDLKAYSVLNQLQQTTLPQSEYIRRDDAAEIEILKQAHGSPSVGDTLYDDVTDLEEFQEMMNDLGNFEVKE